MTTKDSFTDYWKHHKINFAFQDYGANTGTLVSPLSFPPELDEIIDSDKYVLFSGKKVETTLFEEREGERGVIDVYFQFNCDGSKDKASKIARIFPGSFSSFQNDLIDAIIMHSLAIGREASEHRVLLPTGIAHFIGARHCRIGSLQDRQQNYFLRSGEQKKYIPVFMILESSEVKDALSELLIQPSN